MWIAENVAVVPEVTEYSLRHTAATNFVNAAVRAGYGLKAIANHLGCTVPTLSSVYLHDEDESDNTDGLEEVMSRSHMQKPPRKKLADPAASAAMDKGKVIRFRGKAVNE